MVLDVDETSGISQEENDLTEKPFYVVGTCIKNHQKNILTCRLEKRVKSDESDIKFEKELEEDVDVDTIEDEE
jgi:hypothetical protein